MYSWVDHKTMQTNNYNNKNKPNAASAELTGNNNKLTTQQFHQQQPRPQRAYIVKQHPTKSFWENHLSWNYNMLSQTIFKHRALQVLQKHTSQTKEILVQPTVFQTTGMIYAMVHLRTNRIYVIATKRKLSTSFLKTALAQWLSPQYKISSKSRKRKTTRRNDLACRKRKCWKHTKHQN